MVLTIEEMKQLKERRKRRRHAELEKVRKQRECRVCGHTWVSQVFRPKTCPRCKSYDWNGRNVVAWDQQELFYAE